MTEFLSNAFNDPSNPWYYVIGLLFLALIFGALAVYIILTNKNKKKTSGDKSEEQQENNAEEVKDEASEADGGNDSAKDHAEQNVPTDNEADKKEDGEQAKVKKDYE